MRIEKRERDNRELRRRFEEEEVEHHHLPLLVVRFLKRYSYEDMSSCLRFYSKALQQLSITGLQWSGLVKCMAPRD